MKSAELLILAYRSYKKGLQTAAEKIFVEAMEDETAPVLMEKIFNLDEVTDEALIEDQEACTDKEDDVEIVKVEEMNEDDDIEVVEVEEPEEDEAIDDSEDVPEEDKAVDEASLAGALDETQVAQLKAIANIVSSKNESDLAKKIIKLIRK